ncbi:MAG TPA: hypothetical protein VFU55_06645 [Terracidiphilus sp.]|nr:hypothetical protein [Terracidiphilus sp.]
MMNKFGSELESEARQYLWIRNAEDTPIVLCVEPWGNELTISQGNDYLLVFEGPKGEYPAIEWKKGKVTVYGWQGSAAWVFLNREVILSCDTRVPEMPR